MTELFTVDKLLSALTILLISPSIAVVIINIWGKRWTESKLENEKFIYQNTLQKEIEKLKFEFQRELQKEVEITKAFHQKEIEIIRNGYQRDLEIHKLKLEKSKAMFLRFSEHQFKQYNELWSSLFDLKIAADKLWDSATKTNMKVFITQLNKANQMLGRSILLLEDEHYRKLMDLMDKFLSYQIGKEKLITLRNMAVSNNFRVDQWEIENLIRNNEMLLEEYSYLLVEIGHTLRMQIKG